MSRTIRKAIDVNEVRMAGAPIGEGARAAEKAVEAAALDKAFEALQTYGWGADRGALASIDAAASASHRDARARKELEARLAAVLKGPAPAAAKDFVCRELSLIGTADSVSALSPILLDKELSDMARYALERMPCPEAVAALREALPKMAGLKKVGVINSLGVRRDAATAPQLIPLLEDADREISTAASAALGAIGTPEAARALVAFRAKAPKELCIPAADACLKCAEQLLADGKGGLAAGIYESLMGLREVPHIYRAAARGFKAARGER